MDCSKISTNEKFYLSHHPKNKFWEIWNQGPSNHVRYGKLKNGFELNTVSGVSTYQDSESALTRALTLIMMKQENGYIITKVTQGVENRFTNILQNRLNTPNKHLISLDIEPVKKSPSNHQENDAWYLRIYNTYSSIEDILNALSLSQYLYAFQDERVSIHEFYGLNENDLERLNIPPSARRKILRVLSFN